MTLRTAAIWLLTACPLLAGAQTAYVTDALGLGLHHAQDASDPPFDTLDSGTELEVLERAADHARVRTTDGREGWVEAAYLVDQRSAQPPAAALEEELETLRGRAASYEERLEIYRGALPWPWVAAALVVALAAGFAAGWWCLDALMRRRHGGFRIW